jgi:hypothetical protein
MNELPLSNHFMREHQQQTGGMSRFAKAESRRQQLLKKCTNNTIGMF